MHFVERGNVMYNSTVVVIMFIHCNLFHMVHHTGIMNSLFQRYIANNIRSPFILNFVPLRFIVWKCFNIYGSYDLFLIFVLRFYLILLFVSSFFSVFVVCRTVQKAAPPKLCYLNLDSLLGCKPNRYALNTINHD